MSKNRQSILCFKPVLILPDSLNNLTRQMEHFLYPLGFILHIPLESDWKGEAKPRR